MKRKSRRQFLGTAAVSAAGLLTTTSLPSWARRKTPVPATAPLAMFGYSAIQLLDGPFRVQFDQNQKLFLGLDEDGLLKPFRQREGLPAPGPDMGGWYDNADDFNEKDNFHAFIAGHSFGQYVSGLARAYAVTGSKATQEKVQRLVRGFAETVEPSGKFYVDYRLPAYTFDKTCCGLIDAHEFARTHCTGRAQAEHGRSSATSAGESSQPRRTGGPAAQRPSPTPGTKPTRCRRISSWRISEAGTSATGTSASALSITSITTRSRKTTMPCPANMPIATSIRSVRRCKPI